MRYLICIFSFVCLLFAGQAYALDEKLEFMDVTLPLNWEVVKSTNDMVEFQNRHQQASFIFRKVPVYNVSIEEYSRALMKAHSGFNFTRRTDTIYYFEHMLGYNSAWTLVEYYNGRKDMLTIQTGIGESADFTTIMDSIILK